MRRPLLLVVAAATFAASCGRHDDRGRIETELLRDPRVLAATDAPTRHLRLSEMMAARGEVVAARGHRVRAALASEAARAANR